MGESSSASYIRMVQHLIEQCLVFHMNKNECMEALAKHANIQPVITSTGVREGERGVLPDIHEGPRGEGFGDGGCGEEDTEDPR
nr:PREDICTED: uncharacterized protein LOC103999278 isoform X2 [Musa acuminata subsp. malaccensis]